MTSPYDLVATLGKWARSCWGAVASLLCGNAGRLPPLGALSSKNASVIAHVQRVYDSAEFQKDPRGYMTRWRERRGYTEEWRVPEDESHGILFGIVYHSHVQPTASTN
jgi:hypothetical protein